MSFLLALLSLYTIVRGNGCDIYEPDLDFDKIVSIIGNPVANVWCVQDIIKKKWLDGKEGIEVGVGQTFAPGSKHEIEDLTEASTLSQVESSPEVTTTNTCYDTNPSDTQDITAIAAQNVRDNCPAVNPNHVKAVFYPGSNNILLLCFRKSPNPPIEWRCFKITKRLNP